MSESNPLVGMKPRTRPERAPEDEPTGHPQESRRRHRDDRPLPYMISDEDLLDTAYLPGEFSAIGLEDVDQKARDGHRALDINIPVLRSYFAPTSAGTLCGILGQTSMGKSMLLHYLEHRAALQLAHEGRDDEYVIHISFEEPIEEMATLALARHSQEPLSSLIRGNVADRPGLSAVSMGVAQVPVCYIGDSVVRSAMRKRPIPQDAFSLTNIFRTITLLSDMLGKRPALIAFDYLQAMPIDRSLANEPNYLDQRRLQVRHDVYSLRRMAVQFGATVWVAIQAKQELRGVRYDKMNPVPHIPGMYDGEETSAIAQRLDRMLSIWIPGKTYPVGTMLQMGPDPSDLVTIDEQLAYIKVVKQRGGLPSGRTYRCQMLYESGDIHVPQQ